MLRYCWDRYVLGYNGSLSKQVGLFEWSLEGKNYEMWVEPFGEC